MLIGILKDGRVEVLQDLSHITSLGRDLDKTKMFHQESMDLTINAISEYSKELKRLSIQPSSVLVTATEASRVAKNANEFYQKVKADFGLSTNIISSEGEAYYTAVGTCLDVSRNNNVIMDMGGASTEFIQVTKQPFCVESSFSLPIGSVRARDLILADKYQDYFKTNLALDITLATTEVIAVAGTMTTVAAMIFCPNGFASEKIHNLKISSDQLTHFYEEISELSEENLIKKFPVVGKRANVIQYGLRAVNDLAYHYKIKNFVISCYGLRFGTLFQGEIDERFTTNKF
jgi:exopolyphosphatase/guanosine-5'-triphosphate,3'-diphosphate pyrophosphatase